MPSGNKKQKDNSSRVENSKYELKKDKHSCFGPSIEDSSEESEIKDEFVAQPHLARQRVRRSARQVKSLITDAIFSCDFSSNEAHIMAESPVSRSVLGAGLGGNENTINVYLEIPENDEDVRRFLVDTLQIDDALDDNFSINLHTCGPVDVRDVRSSTLPVRCGAEIGNVKGDGFGTLGCLARGLDKERSNRVLLLSNNHVIGRNNKAESGEGIVSGTTLLARFERLKPIDFNGGQNFIDAATGWCWQDRVRPEMAYYTRHGAEYFTVSSSPCDPFVDQAVAKIGRTTNRTEGHVTGIEVDIKVNYSPGRVAYFRDQIMIEGASCRFSEQGDSGSLIFTNDDPKNPVGLLFAGGGDYTLANKISHVLAILDIRLCTECQ